MVGQQVQHGLKFPPDHRQAFMNDRTGTLLEVKRTRGIVDFDQYGTWDIRLCDLQAPGELEDCYIHIPGLASH